MSWNNNSYQNNNRSNYNQNRNSNGGNNYNNQGYNRPQKKHSGAKFGYCLGDAERPFIRGWRSTKRFGLITYMCVTYKGTKSRTSGTGKEWENWMCTLQFADGKSEIVSCLYNVQAKKILIPKLGIVINPSAPNGGYCGTFTKRK